MTNSINIVYLRVSKKNEEEQDLDAQKDVILSKYKPENPLILQERGTAYRLENVQNRLEFIKLLNMCFENKGITDLFIQNFSPKEINIYVWDLNRIMRNLKFNLLFSLLASIHKINIYSYNDRDLNAKKDSEDEDNYDESFISLLLAVLSAKKAEDYSRDVSKNTKKSFIKFENSSYSRDGNKVGTRFKNSKGDKLTITSKEENDMYSFILNKISYFESRNIKYYYPVLKEYIQKKYKDILVSDAYLSNIKKKWYQQKDLIK